MTTVLTPPALFQQPLTTHPDRPEPMQHKLLSTLLQYGGRRVMPGEPSLPLLMPVSGSSAVQTLLSGTAVHHSSQDAQLIHGPFTVPAVNTAVYYHLHQLGQDPRRLTLHSGYALDYHDAWHPHAWLYHPTLNIVHDLSGRRWAGYYGLHLQDNAPVDQPGSEAFLSVALPTTAQGQISLRRQSELRAQFGRAVTAVQMH